MFIKDIIVLTKYCRIFLVVLNIVVGHSKRVDACLIIKPIFPYLKHLYILLLRPLIVLRISFKDSKAYIKRHIYSFLVKSTIIAYNREVGALGRLSMPYSGSQPRLSPFLRSEKVFTLELSFPTVKRD